MPSPCSSKTWPRRWIYEAVFRLPLIFEDEVSAVFKFENTLINLLNVSEAPELIQPAAVASADSGARMQFTIEVDDVDAMCAELPAAASSCSTAPWTGRGVSDRLFRDPAGHVWEMPTRSAQTDHLGSLDGSGMSNDGRVGWA